jgi:hypothetical protein
MSGQTSRCSRATVATSSSSTGRSTTIASCVGSWNERALSFERPPIRKCFSCCSRASRNVCCRAAARDVRVCHLGHAERGALHGARSLRHQAALLCADTRWTALRIPGQSAACIDACVPPSESRRDGLGSFCGAAYRSHGPFSAGARAAGRPLDACAIRSSRGASLLARHPHPLARGPMRDVRRADSRPGAAGGE